MRRLASIVALLMVTFTAWPQQRFVKTFNTLADLLATNPNDLHTVAVIKGYASATDADGNMFKYDPASVEATNATTVFKPNNFNGRWLSMGLGSYSNPTFGTNITFCDATGTNCLTVSWPLTNFVSGQLLTVTTNNGIAYLSGTNLPVSTVVFDTIEELVATPIPLPGIGLLAYVRDPLRGGPLAFYPNSVETTNRFDTFASLDGPGNWKRPPDPNVYPQHGVVTGGLVTNDTLVAALTLQGSRATGQVKFSGQYEFLYTDDVVFAENGALYFEDGAQATGLNLSFSSLTNASVYGLYAIAAVADPSVGALHVTNSTVLVQSPRFLGYSGNPVVNSGSSVRVFTYDSAGFVLQAGNGATNLVVSDASGYLGTGTKALFDDGTFKVPSGGGTTINPTDGFLPVRTNSTTFINSPLKVNDPATSASAILTADFIGIDASEALFFTDTPNHVFHDTGFFFEGGAGTGNPGYHVLLNIENYAVTANSATFPGSGSAAGTKGIYANVNPNGTNKVVNAMSANVDPANYNISVGMDVYVEPGSGHGLSTNIGLASLINGGAQQSQKWVAGLFEMGRAPNVDPVIENAVLLLDSRNSSHPLLIARTNNGTAVFKVNFDGSITFPDGTSQATAAAAGGITGSGTAGNVPVWTASTAQGDSVMKISSVGAVTGVESIVVTNSVSADGFYIGNGSFDALGLFPGANIDMESNDIIGIDAMVFDASSTLSGNVAVSVPSLVVTNNATVGTINGNTFTTGTGTLTLGSGKTITLNNTVTFNGTDATTMTFPTTSATVARTDLGQTFIGTHNFGALASAATITAATSVSSSTATITNGLTLVSTTWAAIPAAASNTGVIVRVSDVGTAGSLWVSDGTRWIPLNGVVQLITTALPMILPSSGSIGNNGALTAITALPSTFANCYMYFPVDTIAAGVAAGLYYVQMSSTTAGTIFNNVYTSGLPTIPASPTAFSTTGPGAYTQTTGADISLVSYTVKGGIMGINGGLSLSSMWGHNSSAGNKILRVRYGGTAFVSLTDTTSTSSKWIYNFGNMGVANLQVSQGSAWSTTATSVAIGTAAINSAADQTLVWQVQLATATDFVFLNLAWAQLVQ